MRGKSSFEIDGRNVCQVSAPMRVRHREPTWRLVMNRQPCFGGNHHVTHKRGCSNVSVICATDRVTLSRIQSPEGHLRRYWNVGYDLGRLTQKRKQVTAHSTHRCHLIHDAAV